AVPTRRVLHGRVTPGRVELAVASDLTIVLRGRVGRRALRRARPGLRVEFLVDGLDLAANRLQLLEHDAVDLVGAHDAAFVSSRSASPSAREGSGSSAGMSMTLEKSASPAICFSS